MAFAGSGGSAALALGTSSPSWAASTVGAAAGGGEAGEGAFAGPAGVAIAGALLLAESEADGWTNGLFATLAAKGFAMGGGPVAAATVEKGDSDDRVGLHGSFGRAGAAAAEVDAAAAARVVEICSSKRAACASKPSAAPWPASPKLSTKEAALSRRHWAVAAMLAIVATTEAARSGQGVEAGGPGINAAWARASSFASSRNSRTAAPLFATSAVASFTCSSVRRIFADHCRSNSSALSRAACLRPMLSANLFCNPSKLYLLPKSSDSALLMRLWVGLALSKACSRCWSSRVRASMTLEPAWDSWAACNAV